MRKMILCTMVMLVLNVKGASEMIDGIKWEYYINGDGFAMLSSPWSGWYDSSIPPSTLGDITIPSKFGGCALVEIGQYSFKECDKLSSVVIPDGVTNINYHAFEHCTLMTNVVMSKNLVNIGTGAFQGCSSLKDMHIPDSVKIIGTESFYGCNSITNVVVGTGVSEIGERAFSGCSSIERLSFVNNGKIIFRNGAFECSALEGVYISNLQAWCVSSFECQYLSRSANPLYYAKKLYLNGVIVTDLQIPNDVEAIGSYVFYNCDSLTSVVISDGVKCIYTEAFGDCSSLEEVYIPNSVRSIYPAVFANCGSIKNITIPQVLCKSKLSDCFPSYQSITNVVVADGVTTIGTNCFKNCKSMKTLRIPSTVRYIEEGALYGCEGLEKIIFEGDAPYVGEDVFIGTSRRMEICVAKGSIGWNGTASAELPEFWNGYVISHLSNSGDSGSGSGSGDEGLGGGSSGGEIAVVDARYDLADDVADRAIANVEIDGDATIDSFVLKDGKVYDSVVRIVNTSASKAKISLPGGFIYEKFKGTKPLEIPATSTNLLTITRTKGDTFLLSREELVLEVQE